MDLQWHVTQISARERYTIPRLIHRAGKLRTFTTDVWIPDVASCWPLQRLASRYHPELANQRVHSNVFNAFRAFVRRNGDQFSEWLNEGTRFASWAADVASENGLAPGHAVFGYTCASLELLKRAKSVGALAVLGQVDPGLAWYKMQDDEVERWPGAAATDSQASRSVFFERLRQEWQTADVIIVNSEYSRRSMISEGTPAAKLKIVPLAFESPLPVLPRRAPPIEGRFRVLYVGNISLGKGFPYFAEAAAKLGASFEFVAAGSVRLSPSFLRVRNWPVKLLGHLDAVSLASEYARARAFVFPTLSDGFGQVQVEAMAHGLPVIATENCAEIVEDQVSGLLVPIRSADAIAEAILRLRDDATFFEKLSSGACMRSLQFSLDQTSEAFFEAVDNLPRLAR